MDSPEAEEGDETRIIPTPCRSRLILGTGLCAVACYCRRRLVRHHLSRARDKIAPRRGDKGIYAPRVGSPLSGSFDAHGATQDERNVSLWARTLHHGDSEYPHVAPVKHRQGPSPAGRELHLLAVVMELLEGNKKKSAIKRRGTKLPETSWPRSFVRSSKAAPGESTSVAFFTATSSHNIVLHRHRSKALPILPSRVKIEFGAAREIQHSQRQAPARSSPRNMRRWSNGRKSRPGALSRYLRTCAERDDLPCLDRYRAEPRSNSQVGQRRISCWPRPKTLRPEGGTACAGSTTRFGSTRPGTRHQWASGQQRCPPRSTR